MAGIRAVKGPALAGGAALLGLAGGVALGSRRTSGAQAFGKSLADTSKNLGRFGENLGQFAIQMEKTREMVDARPKRRSPIEVVLQGLTQRR